MQAFLPGLPELVGLRHDNHDDLNIFWAGKKCWSELLVHKQGQMRTFRGGNKEESKQQFLFVDAWYPHLVGKSQSGARASDLI